MTFEIREIQPSDDAAIAAIIRQVLTEFGANRPGFAWADPELDHLSNAYVGDRALYYVVTHANQVIGGAGIAPFPCEQAHLCELQKMYLLPGFRGQGIGRHLMQRLLDAAITLRYRGCYLETFDAMHSAIALYQKSGFEPVKTPLGDSGHNSCNRFFVRWFEA
ncbi:GNAT family N-acetyltransferase [Halomicronema sp. CCY15110]|uniref:GNAT family N-acetyltransferase n=1 Tax=Halomicronema sp. CCY15110 TaxID=2767773 RepID=UPI00194ED54A|nr:GNAT family N-acetyltransferase [Halomicronema sp. CCY15110]